MRHLPKDARLLIAAFTMTIAATPAGAQQVPLQDKPFAEHKIVLQLSDNDPRKQGLYDVKPDARPARNLFAFSILFLFALFASLLAEHLFAIGPLKAVL